MADILSKVLRPVKNLGEDIFGGNHVDSDTLGETSSETKAEQKKQSSTGSRFDQPNSTTGSKAKAATEDTLTGAALGAGLTALTGGAGAEESAAGGTAAEGEEGTAAKEGEQAAEKSGKSSSAKSALAGGTAGSLTSGIKSGASNNSGSSGIDTSDVTMHNSNVSNDYGGDYTPNTSDSDVANNVDESEENNVSNLTQSVRRPK